MTFEWTEYESPTTAVISAVSAVENSPPDELPPLADTVDPDALEALVNATDSSREGADSVTFTYCDYQMKLLQHGELRLVPTTESSGDSEEEASVNSEAGSQ